MNGLIDFCCEESPYGREGVWAFREGRGRWGIGSCLVWSADWTGLDMIVGFFMGSRFGMDGWMDG
jgi:hypothetical protein